MRAPSELGERLTALCGTPCYVKCVSIYPAAGCQDAPGSMPGAACVRARRVAPDLNTVCAEAITVDAPLREPGARLARAPDHVTRGAQAA